MPSPLTSPTTTARAGARGEGLLGLEGAVAVAQQHRDACWNHIGHGQVGIAVAVEVADDDGFGGRARGEGLLGLEGAIAVAQKHRHRSGGVIGDGQVGLAIAVEISDRDRVLPRRARRERLLGLEGAVAVAQKHRHRVGSGIDHGQVGIGRREAETDRRSLGGRGRQLICQGGKDQALSKVISLHHLTRRQRGRDRIT